MNDTTGTNVDVRVRKLLESARPDPLDPNILLRQYKAIYTTDLICDAEKEQSWRPPGPGKGGKRPKLKEVLCQFPCCDVIMEQSSRDHTKNSRMLVRLREDMATESATVGLDSEETLSDEAPSQKRRRRIIPVGSDSAVDPGADNEPCGNLRVTAPAADTTEDLDRLDGGTGRPASYCEMEEKGPGVLDDEDLLIQVLQRYQSSGALEADNLLETMHGQGREGINALRSIIHYELDPTGLSDAPPEANSTQSSLTRALCSFAMALYLSREFPFQARQQAAMALQYANETDIEVPLEWIKHSEKLTASVKASTNSVGSETTDPEDEWDDIKKMDRKAPSVMCDSIIPMIGLQEVKRSFINMYHRVRLSKEQGDTAAASYNVRFEGNPGTGKTTIARHYGTFLRQLGVLDEKSLFREISGAKLIHNGVQALEEMLQEIKKAGSGVVFVDEAYQLISDREGKKALDFILPLAESLETEYGGLVWIFAGYKKKMETLFEHNEGLPSRFPLRFIFDDYKDEELQLIFEDLMIYKSTSSNKPLRSSDDDQKTPKTNRSSNHPYRSNAYGGSKMAGRVGGTWTYNTNMGWTDEYGNLTIDPAQVGTLNFELVTSIGDRWTEANGSWTNQDGFEQSHYPGSPAPVNTCTRERRSVPFSCENEDKKHLRIAIKRLGRCRGENGFGNARAVRGLFEKVRERQAARIADERKYGKTPDVFILTKNDILGPNVDKATLEKSAAWKKLKSMEGLVPVKESVKQLFELVLKNIDREKREEPLYEIVLNRLFLGNPGTGKTTVAELYARILADLGLLSKGEVVMKCASDFVGGALGQSEKQTLNILKAAEGNVLVIDEAYSLYSGGAGKTGSNDPYKTAVVDTIVERVQAKPGADMAVIMLGYKEEMEEMMSKVNPGLSRRFQIENAFIFPDFDDASLCRIMMQSSRQQQVVLKLPVAKRAVRMLAKARMKPHFGNAGSVSNLLSKAIVSMQARENAEELIPADFGYSGDEPDSSLLNSLFDDLIGCDEIKGVMDELRATVEFSAAQGRTSNRGVSFNFLFLGNPGTGKTTVARRMGKLFHALGLLASDELKEAKATDLITGYTGQAGKQTRELLRASRGGVLFIDEAYQLNPARGGHYMTEAVDELVGALTEEEFQGKILVILAGYNNDMEDMLKTNPGLDSRFSERVSFQDFDAKATVQLLVLELQKLDIPFSSDNVSKLEQLAQRLVTSKGFGNGRDVVSWANDTYKVVAKRYRNTKSTTRGITSSLSDIEEALTDLLKSRQGTIGGQSCSATSGPRSDAMASQEETKAPPPPHVTKISVETEMLQEKEDIESDVSPSMKDLPNSLFEGINESVLKTLQGFVDEQGLDSEEGVRRLAQLNSESPEFAELVMRLQTELNMSPVDAKTQLLEWQSRHEDLDEMLKQQAHKVKTIGVRPIWRCGVCGQADKPWIACYVAPFIVRYEKVPVGEGSF